MFSASHCQTKGLGGLLCLLSGERTGLALHSSTGSQPPLPHPFSWTIATNACRRDTSPVSAPPPPTPHHSVHFRANAFTDLPIHSSLPPLKTQLMLPPTSQPWPTDTTLAKAPKALHDAKSNGQSSLLVLFGIHAAAAIPHHGPQTFPSLDFRPRCRLSSNVSSVSGTSCWLFFLGAPSSDPSLFTLTPEDISPSLMAFYNSQYVPLAPPPLRFLNMNIQLPTQHLHLHIQKAAQT